jgi:hypothetical protein
MLKHAALQTAGNNRWNTAGGGCFRGIELGRDPAGAEGALALPADGLTQPLLSVINGISSASVCARILS